MKTKTMKPNIKDDIKTLMEGWNHIKQTAKKQFPSASAEEIDRMTRSAMSHTLNIQSTHHEKNSN